MSMQSLIERKAAKAPSLTPVPTELREKVRAGKVGNGPEATHEWTPMHDLGRLRLRGTQVPAIQSKSHGGGVCPRGRLKTLRDEQTPYLHDKLRVGPPHDKYEREADRIADQVMRMPEPNLQRHVNEEIKQKRVQTNAITPLIEREVVSEERKEDANLIQARRASSTVPTVTPAVKEGIQGLQRSGGEPLPRATRAFMESRFGHDFSRVRIHSDARAAETARAIDSRAYALGEDLVFGAGQYAPSSYAGKRLLAHELTHVLQQCGRTDAAETQLRPSTPSVIARAPLDADNPGLLDRVIRIEIYLGEKGDEESKYRTTFFTEHGSSYDTESTLVGVPPGSYTLKVSKKREKFFEFLKNSRVKPGLRFEIDESDFELDELSYADTLMLKVVPPVEDLEKELQAQVSQLRDEFVVLPEDEQREKAVHIVAQFGAHELETIASQKNGRQLLGQLGLILAESTLWQTSAQVAGSLAPSFSDTLDLAPSGLPPNGRDKLPGELTDSAELAKSFLTDRNIEEGAITLLSRALVRTGWPDDEIVVEDRSLSQIHVIKSGDRVHISVNYSKAAAEAFQPGPGGRLPENVPTEYNYDPADLVTLKLQESGEAVAIPAFALLHLEDKGHLGTFKVWAMLIEIGIGLSPKIPKVPKRATIPNPPDVPRTPPPSKIPDTTGPSRPSGTGAKAGEVSDRAGAAAHTSSNVPDAGSESVGIQTPRVRPKYPKGTPGGKGGKFKPDPPQVSDTAKQGQGSTVADAGETILEQKSLSEHSKRGLGAEGPLAAKGVYTLFRKGFKIFDGAKMVGKRLRLWSLKTLDATGKTADAILRKLQGRIKGEFLRPIESDQVRRMANEFNTTKPKIPGLAPDFVMPTKGLSNHPSIEMTVEVQFFGGASEEVAEAKNLLEAWFDDVAPKNAKILFTD